MNITAYTDGGSRSFPLAGPRNLGEALEEAGLLLNRRCAGLGVCSGCRVFLEAGAYQIDGNPVEVRDGTRYEALACKTLAMSGNAVVFVPRSSLVEQAAQIEERFALRPVEFGVRTPVVQVALAEPKLGQASADCERLEREVCRQGGVEGPLAFPLELLKTLPETIADSQGRLQVTLANRQGAWGVVRVAPDTAPPRAFGLAVDIGTTTVVVGLVDLMDGRLVASAALYNQQIARADDVSARISYCQTPRRLEELQSLVTQTINPLVALLVEQERLDPADIVRMAVSGNTVMTHLFFGINPVNIGRLPFQPVARVFAPCVAGALGLNINPQAVVEAVPCVAGYIGGDIVADLYAANVRQRSGATLLVDVGTNCEIVLADAGRLVACAAAAGPAFEGAGLACGCRAAEGAIEHLTFDERLVFSLRVIGQTAPVGLCGSAIVDFMAQSCRCGLLNAMGRFDLALLKARGCYRTVRSPCGKSHACLIAPEAQTLNHEAICVSEYDISQILKAKAAIYAGMQTLLATEGRDFAGLGRIVLAGGFAKHLHLGHAMEIGLLPRLPEEMFEIIGNGSLAGAYLALVETHALGTMGEIALLPRIVELNLVAEFQHHFVDAMALPESEWEAAAAAGSGTAQA